MLACLNKRTDKNKINAILMRDDRALAGVRLSPSSTLRDGSGLTGGSLDFDF